MTKKKYQVKIEGLLYHILETHELKQLKFIEGDTEVRGSPYIGDLAAIFSS